MRCSECFGEMVEKPEGLVCKSCGFSVQIVDEDSDLAGDIVPRPRRRLPLIRMVATALFVLALGGAGYWLWLHPEAVRLETYFASASESDVPSIVLRDDENLIAYETPVLGSNGQASILGETSCMHVSEGRDTTPAQLKWLDRSGALRASLSPQLPANWRLTDVCRSMSGQVISMARSTDGIAVSRLSGDGTIVWTRILPAISGDAHLSMLSKNALILTRKGPTEFELTVFDRDGQELWRRAITDIAPETSPVEKRNSVGDLMLAWNTAEARRAPVLRVLALSGQNTINFSETYRNRTLPIVGLAGDDFANTYVLEGAAGFSLQKLRADGSLDWRRWLDATARPLGVIVDGSDLIIAAHYDYRLLFWRVTEDGARSVPVAVELSELISSASIDALENDRARMTLTLVTGAQRQVLINLVRLREAADMSASEIDSAIQPGSPASEINRSARAVLAPSELDGIDAVLEAREPIIVDPDEGLSTDETAIERETNPITPLPEDERAPDPVQSASQTEVTISRRLDSEPLAEDRSVSNLPAGRGTRADLKPSELECTFFCAAPDNSEATYPITRIIALGEVEALESLEARLEQVHAQICAESGGQLLVDSLPNCTAQ